MTRKGRADGSFGPFGRFCLVVPLAACASLPAHAGAFLNTIQSADAGSVSTAGQTAVAEDATTVYYNAAGMTALDHAEIVVTVPAVDLATSFHNAGTTDAMGNPVRGSAGNKTQTFPIPSFFAVMPLSDRLSAGLGIFIPFGQANSYPTNWVGRYQVQRISLKTLDIDPALAYRVTETLSVGAGVDLQYAHLVRQSALDLARSASSHWPCALRRARPCPAKRGWTAHRRRRQLEYRFQPRPPICPG